MSFYRAMKAAFPQRACDGVIGGPDCMYCKGAKRTWHGAYEDSDGEHHEAGWWPCACDLPIPNGVTF